MRSAKNEHMTEDLYERVLDIVGRVLGRGAVDPMADLLDLGASSIDILQIVELVNEECGTVVAVTDPFDAPDIDSFARLVVDKHDAQTAAG